VSSLGSRDQAAGRTQRKEGEKTLRNLVTLQVKVLEIADTQTPPELKEHCSFEMSLNHRVGLKPLLPLVFCSNHVSHVAQDDLDKLKPTPTLQNKSARDWDTTYFENNLQSH